MILFFRERLNGVTPTTKWVSASAYTAYIVHPFFVILPAWLIAQAPIPDLIKVAVVSTIAVVTCFTVSNLLRKIPPLPRIL